MCIDFLWYNGQHRFLLCWRLKMKIKSLFVVLPVLTVGMVLQAIDYSTWIYQTNSDTNSQPASTGGYSFAGGTFWSSKAKPSEGNSYYVPNTITNMSPNKNQSNSTYYFPGDALAIAGTFSMRTGSGKNVYYKELHFLDGAFGMWDSVGSITGGVKIIASESTPAIWRFNYSPTESKNYTVSIKSDISGPEGACVRLERKASTSKVKLTWAFTGDCSEYYGTLLIADTMSTIFDKLKELDFPGYLGAADGYVMKIGEHVCTNYAAHAGGILSVAATSGEQKIGRLKLKNGGMLKIPYAAGSTAVLALSALDVEPGAKLHLDGLTISDITTGDKPPVIPIFRLDAGIPVPDVSKLEIIPKVAGILPNFRLTNIVDESGRTDICVTWKEVVHRTSDDSSTDNSFLENEIKWSDGKTPEAGKDYLCQMKITLNSGSASFGGDSLSLGDSFFYFKGNRLTVADLHFLPGLTVDIYANSTTKIIDGGTLALHPGDDYTPRIRFFQGRTLRIDSELTGSGTIKLYNKTNETEPHGTFIPAALNTNYHGRVILQTYPQPASGQEPLTPNAATDSCMRMVIADGRNLGGEFTADENTFSAITITGQSLVKVTNSVSFVEPTRGIFIDNAARFNVSAGKTVAFKNTLTLSGELWKEGAGEMLFDGKVQFYADGISENPVIGTNVVRVKAGTVRVGSPDAADGIAFIFSKDSCLTVDASDDASGYGLCLKKPGSALSTEEADAKITVVASGFDRDADSIVCAIVTAASTTEAEAMSKKLHVRRPAGFGTAKLAIRTNDDGTATVTATIFKSGFTITVR